MSSLSFNLFIFQIYTMTGAKVFLVFGAVTSEDFYGIHTFQITASNLDSKLTTGLCGSYNDNPDDDMTPQGEATNIDDPEAFAESWRYIKLNSKGLDNQVINEIWVNISIFFFVVNRIQTNVIHNSIR